MQDITVAVDAMGGDFGPRVTVPAVVQALLHFPDLKIVLVGDNDAVNQQLLACGYHPNSDLESKLADRLIVQHSQHVISNSLKPSQALRKSSGTSMAMSIDLVANAKAGALVSSGNTGALMALSRRELSLLPGIERPALVSAMPTKQGNNAWMLDLGANIVSDEEALFQFAVMGSALAEQHLDRPARVALLNIGVEDIKGVASVKRCAELLARTNSVNYIGYIEANKLFDDIADVIVCDGFTGNSCLKASEGTAQFFIEKLTTSMMSSSIKGWIGRKLFSGLLKEVKALNPDQYNGASLLGLRGIVIKSHGSADVSAVVNAIGEAVHEVKRQVPSRIRDRLEAVLLERH
ncbi:phosphate acyltransferase PlsX [Vibrio sp. S4M6]|uniref:phosphate acyltransferase PlsX n=1 Tax=Vibrio sinus TaxID=2946865 RepID=UPI00202A1CBB|nr:phosphate acyltransferase PlsX [Vibrio sinus]MCL9783688.1 phosphate acyltransferase PlsX [Vibrio sinus]